MNKKRILDLIGINIHNLKNRYYTANHYSKFIKSFINSNEYLLEPNADFADLMYKCSISKIKKEYLLELLKILKEEESFLQKLENKKYGILVRISLENKEIFNKKGEHE